ncbi:MAG: family 43 glycosylhydrolase, partial [Candidatus Scatosoma sp.]
VEENGETVRKVSLDPRNFTRTDEFYEVGEGNNVNEGAHMIENNGKFYLTYSPTGTGNILYSICQAVSDSPLGPFKKLTECNPVIGLNATNDYMSCTGHHSFVYIEDEIFALYHCFWQELSASGGRCLAADRVKFMYNPDLQHDVLYGLGPTQAVQPANKAHTCLENVAQTAEISVSSSGNKDSVQYLTDGFFPSQEFTKDWEFTAKDAVTITLKWDKPQEISALFIYNAYSYYNAFDKIDWIKFELSQSPDWSEEKFTRAVIQDLKCDPNNVNENELCMRQGGGAVASFKPIKVTKLEIHISSKYSNEFGDGTLGENKNINVSELYIMGKEA